MIPKAGPRRTLIQFESAVTSSDDHGGEIVELWQQVATAWCELKTLSAFEQMRAMRLQIEATHQIIAPWSMELAVATPRHRANIGGRVLNILSVIDTDELHEELVILAQEGVPT